MENIDLQGLLGCLVLIIIFFLLIYYFIRTSIRKIMGMLVGLDLSVEKRMAKRNDNVPFRMKLKPNRELVINTITVRLYCQATGIKDLDAKSGTAKVLRENVRVPKGEELVIEDVISVSSDAVETTLLTKWLLRIELDIPGLPDAEKEVAITVLPQ